jgi:2-polyprenyl-3-methyl-5-hydroxy-6-metoxy-1,4-benzoquinol methylase
MRKKSDILKELNRDLPNFDWKCGAKKYVEYYIRKLGREFIEQYSFSKPLASLPETNFEAQLEENVAYFYNFVNTMQLLRLPRRARVLDVACGGGWFSHYLTRMGYSTFGFDICTDFVALAKRRLATDPLIPLDVPSIEDLFIVHDIEAEPLGSAHTEVYNAAILESCLHHFEDPIAALIHLAQALKPDGIMVVIEGENRVGSISKDFRTEMENTETLERSFPRRLLSEILELAGLNHYEYVGSVNGWFSMGDPRVKSLSAIAQDDCGRKNMVICAKTETALARYFPWRESSSSASFAFLVGVYGDEGSGWRWAAPYAQIEAQQKIQSLKLVLRSEVPIRCGREQQIFIHSPTGLRESVTIVDGEPVAVCLESLEKGEILSLSSGDFFVPSQHGSPDTRQLSFALKII